MSIKDIQIQSSKVSTLNERELISIDALLAYTAYDHKISREAVDKVIANRYGINTIEQLPSLAFEDAIRFLVDFQTDMLLN